MAVILEEFYFTRRGGSVMNAAGYEGQQKQAIHVDLLLCGGRAVRLGYYCMIIYIHLVVVCEARFIIMMHNVLCANHVLN